MIEDGEPIIYASQLYLVVGAVLANNTTRRRTTYVGDGQSGSQALNGERRRSARCKASDEIADRQGHARSFG